MLKNVRGEGGESQREIQESGPGLSPLSTLCLDSSVMPKIADSKYERGVI